MFLVKVGATYTGKLLDSLSVKTTTTPPPLLSIIVVREDNETFKMQGL
jgi:hypothetical protein